MESRCRRSDRHISTTLADGTTVTYVRDVLDRIVQRKTTTPATSSAAFTMAADDFNRTVATGWGSATTGGAYSIALGASATPASVSGGQGVLALSPTDTRAMMLSAATAQDTTASVTFSLDAAPSTGSAYAGLIVRQMANSDDNYMVRAWLNANGTVWIAIQKGGTLLKALQLPGITRAAGDAFNLTTTVTGVNPTTITSKVWRVGTAEPSASQLTVTDSTAAVQGSGYVGIHGARSASATTTGTISYSNFTVVSLAGTTIPPTTTVTRYAFAGSGSGAWAQMDGGNHIQQCNIRAADPIAALSILLAVTLTFLNWPRVLAPSRTDIRPAAQCRPVT